LHIKSLHVQNFRSLHNISLTNLGRLNVLIGKNNAGKSTLMRAIALGLSSINTSFSGSLSSSISIDEEFADKDSTRTIVFIVGIGLSEPECTSILEGLEFEDLSPAALFAHNLQQSRELHFTIRCWKRVNQIFSCLIEISVTNTLNESEASKTFKVFELSEELIERIAGISDSIGITVRDIKMFDYVSANRAMLSNNDFNNFFSRADNALGVESGNKLRNLYNADKVVPNFINTSLTKRNEASKSQAQLLAEKEQTLSTAAARDVTLAVLKKCIEVVAASKKLIFGERKQPIDDKDAKQLVSLKTGRQDKERWKQVKTVTKALLGVDLEAYGGDGRPAELEIGEFLPDATGAGIKESLRIIFDLENQKPNITFIEEPEVHLHPALARAMSNYLRQKSNDVQIFITSHSTEFVDASSFQNVYLVSRNSNKETSIQALDTSTGLQTLPAELGLRPSTVFMHDSLVFVEGPSDEEVLREFADKLGLDLAKANVGFIRLGGITNLKSYAAQEVLSLFSQRQVRLWFVVDRDERDSLDIQKMQQQLGDRTNLFVLECRELENYLIDPRAVRKFIALKGSNLSEQALPAIGEIESTIKNISLGLKNDAILLRLKKQLLGPVYPNMKQQQRSPVVDQLVQAREELDQRLSRVGSLIKSTEEEVNQSWDENSINIAPGTLILDSFCRKYGFRFSKDKGDSLRLAKLMSADAIPPKLKEVLRDIATES
jgi:putative ATP-dependent endonuclease of OLD family